MKVHQNCERALKYLICIFGVKLLNSRPTTYNFSLLLVYLYEQTPLAGRMLRDPNINAQRQKAG